MGVFGVWYCHSPSIIIILNYFSDFFLNLPRLIVLLKSSVIIQLAFFPDTEALLSCKVVGDKSSWILCAGGFNCDKNTFGIYTGQI